MIDRGISSIKISNDGKANVKDCAFCTQSVGLMIAPQSGEGNVVKNCTLRS